MITFDFKRIQMTPGSRFLDIGCGEGRHTIRAAQMDDLVCVGADYGYDPLSQTRDKIEFHSEIGDLSCRSVDLSCMDITALPFEDECFDFVLCSEVLEHIPDDGKAMAELCRILKPGCRLAVSVPRCWPEKICWMLSDDYFNANMGHVRIYKAKALIKSFENLGLTYTGHHYAHSLHAPYWWLKCLVGPNRTDSIPVNLYKRFLEWDLMEKPRLTSFLDRLLNPLMGKSVALYFSKP